MIPGQVAVRTGGRRRKPRAENTLEIYILSSLSGKSDIPNYFDGRSGSGARTGTSAVDASAADEDQLGEKETDGMKKMRKHLVVETAVHGDPVPAVPFASQYSYVSPAEGGVEERVTHGVDGAVDVAEIVKEVPQLLRYARAVRRQRLQQHQNVVRSPRDDE